MTVLIESVASRINLNMDPVGPGFYIKLGLPPDPRSWTDENVEHLRSFLNDKRKLADALGFGSARVLKPEEAAKEAEKLSTNLFQSFKTLRYIICRYEAVIQERWSQMTQEERQKILLEAWPDMSPCHRPDLWALRRETAKEREAGTKFKDAYMWPNVNLEDLSGDIQLLLLLNCRGRRPPSVFASADLESAHIGHLSKAIQGLFIPDYDMKMVGDSPATYGTIHSNLSEESVADMLEGKSFKSGDGIDVLEIQERLLGFLVACCKLILNDKQIDVTDQSIPEVKEPPSKAATFNGPGDLSVAQRALEEPYVSPESASWANCQWMMGCRQADAEEHFRNLRQDPGYFVDTVRDWFEHAPEMHVDDQGRSHPYLADPVKRTKFMDRTVGRMVHNAYEEIHVWKSLKDELQYMREVRGEYGYGSDPEEDMPFEDSMARLKMLLDARLLNHYLNKVASYFVSCPQLRDHFTTVQDPKWPLQTRPVLKSGSLEDTDDELLWLWGQITDDESRRICSLENLAGEVERFLEKNPDQKQRLTPLARDAISDLSFVGFIRRQFTLCWPRFFLPRGNKFTDYSAQHAFGWGRSMVGPIWDLVRLVNNSFGDSRIELGEAGDPGSGRFDYPVTEPRTQETADAMHRAEQNLEAFWSKVDQDLRSHMNASSYNSLQRLAPPATRPADPGRSQRFEPRTVAFFQTLFPKPNPLPKKARLPTRGPLLKPDAVYKAYPEGAITTDIPWTEFLYGMESLSFNHEHRNGLLWSFWPNRYGLPKKSVYIHRPYPGDIISARDATRIAQRLKHVYGLWWAMFDEDDMDYEPGDDYSGL